MTTTKEFHLKLCLFMFQQRGYLYWYFLRWELAVLLVLSLNRLHHLPSPTSTTGTIRRALIGVGDVDTQVNIEQINTQPALKADSTPTSNNALSVPLSDIEADDNYGIASDISDV